jgi:SAM-dependent methyltransferase
MQKAPPLRSYYKDPNEQRSEDRLRAHYVLERRLATRLREASSADRPHVYTEVYSELFRSLSDHPQRAENKAGRQRRVRRLLARLMPILGGDKTFLEIGCGDAVMSAIVAAHVAHSYALDVTDALIDRSGIPKNLAVLISNGIEIPLPDRSIDVALSDQLMEHLHPDDARAQLAEIYRVLKPGGVYYCITPNRVTGPHDISRFFDSEATGFHLQEYDSSAILSLFKEVGFHHVRFIVPGSGWFKVPIARFIVRALEIVVLSIPRVIAAHSRTRYIVAMMAGLNVIGTK